MRGLALGLGLFQPRAGSPAPVAIIDTSGTADATLEFDGSGSTGYSTFEWSFTTYTSTTPTGFPNTTDIVSSYVFSGSDQAGTYPLTLTLDGGAATATVYADWNDDGTAVVEVWDSIGSSVTVGIVTTSGSAYTINFSGVTLPASGRYQVALCLASDFSFGEGSGVIYTATSGFLNSSALPHGVEYRMRVVPCDAGGTQTAAGGPWTAAFWIPLTELAQTGGGVNQGSIGLSFSNLGVDHVDVATTGGNWGDPTWDISELGDSDYTLTATMYDASNNPLGTATVAVTVVSNTIQSGTITDSDGSTNPVT